MRISQFTYGTNVVIGHKESEVCDDTLAISPSKLLILVDQELGYRGAEGGERDQLAPIFQLGPPCQWINGGKGNLFFFL